MIIDSSTATIVGTIVSNLITIVVLIKNNDLKFTFTDTKLAKIDKSLDDLVQKTIEEIYNRLRVVEKDHGETKVKLDSCQKLCVVKMEMLNNILSKEIKNDKDSVSTY